MIDNTLVTRKITLILKDLSALTDLSRQSREAYLANPINEVLAERYLERMIGRMIDINYHLITESGQPPPKDYHESFRPILTTSTGLLKNFPANDSGGLLFRKWARGQEIGKVCTKAGKILLRKDKRHRLVLGVRLIQQAAAVEIDVNDVVPT